MRPVGPSGDATWPTQGPCRRRRYATPGRAFAWGTDPTVSGPSACSVCGWRVPPPAARAQGAGAVAQRRRRLDGPPSEERRLGFVQGRRSSGRSAPRASGPRHTARSTLWPGDPHEDRRWSDGSTSAATGRPFPRSAGWIGCRVEGQVSTPVPPDEIPGAQGLPSRGPAEAASARLVSGLPQRRGRPVLAGSVRGCKQTSGWWPLDHGLLHGSLRRSAASRPRLVRPAFDRRSPWAGPRGFRPRGFPFDAARLAQGRERRRAMTDNAETRRLARRLEAAGDSQASPLHRAGVSRGRGSCVRR